jgi:RNA polymerase sigma factor (sigma-70 family)
MDNSAEFEVLVARLRAGDEQAARELLALYEEPIRRIIRVRFTDPALRRQMDSMDICQSVMADFFARTALGQFDLETPQQLVALLATMARNRLINHAKKQRAVRRDVRRLEPGDVAELQPPSDEETPSEIAVGRELLDAFRKRLSPEELDLAERRARGESWADIARATGGKPDALRIRLARALERVSGELGLDESHYD